MMLGDCMSKLNPTAKPHAPKRHRVIREEKPQHKINHTNQRQ